MRNPVILICEDSEPVAHLVSFAVKSQGFDAEIATTTEAIYQKIQLNKPDLILLDLNLPGSGGAEALKKLKDQKETQQIPVILFSGEENLAEKAAELKADGYLCKPFEISDLNNLIDAFLKKVH